MNSCHINVELNQLDLKLCVKKPLYHAIVQRLKGFVANHEYRVEYYPNKSSKSTVPPGVIQHGYLLKIPHEQWSVPVLLKTSPDHPGIIKIRLDFSGPDKQDQSSVIQFLTEVLNIELNALFEQAALTQLSLNVAVSMEDYADCYVLLEKPKPSELMSSFASVTLKQVSSVMKYEDVGEYMSASEKAEIIQARLEPHEFLLQLSKPLASMTLARLVAYDFQNYFNGGFFFSRAFLGDSLFDPDFHTLVERNGMLEINELDQNTRRQYFHFLITRYLVDSFNATNMIIRSHLKQQLSPLIPV